MVRKPRYPNDSDYTTNAPSYYDDLARKQKLIKELSKRIWEYDKELAKRFEEWDKNIETLPEDLERMLTEWMEDGTLAKIIDKNILYNKADKEEVDKQINELIEMIYRESSGKAGVGYIDDKINEINDRIDDIITTPTSDINHQEIIDARNGKDSLGENIRYIESLAKVGIKNVVENGDFKNGLEGHFAGRERVELNDDGNVVLTGYEDGIITGVIAQIIYYDHIPTDENWYFIGRLRALDPLEWISVGARGTTGASNTRVYYPTIAKWYNISHYMTGSDYNEMDGNFSAAVWGADPNVEGKRVEVDYFMAINVTRVFGRGNEPTKEEMDRLLLSNGYFDGEIGSGKLLSFLTKNHNENTEQIKEIKYSTFENVLKYGSGNWRGWTGSLTNYNDKTDEIRLTGVGSSRLVATLQHIEGFYKEGHKFYVTGDFNVNKELTNYGFGLVSGTVSPLPVSYIVDSDVWVNTFKTISGVISVPEDTDYLRIQIRLNYPHEDNVEGGLGIIKNLYMFDLTSFFGRGNEPTKEEFENMLNVIDKNEKHTPVKEMQKASIQLLSNRIRKSENNPLKKPLAVVSFDDHNLSDYEKAFPFLEMRGIKGTSYIITNRVGESGKMDWHHLKELKKAGWDIEFHSHNHINLDQSTNDEIRQDFEAGIQTMIDHGFPKPRHYAYPFGSGTDSDRVKNIISDYVKTARNSRGYFANQNNRYESIDFLRMYGLSIDMNEHRQDRLERIKQLIKQGAENNEIVLLYAHKLVDNPPTNDNIPETIFSQWAELIDYAIDLDYEFLTQNELYLRLK